MASNYFDFKQFRVYHDRCAQKVGTDGVILGAWADVTGARRVLDIGTGSGLIALMMAQRAPEASVTGIDVDEDAVEQARTNAASSPFASRICIELGDVRDYQPNGQTSCCEKTFDCIVCNPPFYAEDTLPPDGQRALARHSSCLPFDELVEAVTRLLSDGGRFSVILPTSLERPFHVLCTSHRLHLSRACHVSTVSRKPPKRVMMTFTHQDVENPLLETLVLMKNGERSNAYNSLTRDFYL